MTTRHKTLLVAIVLAFAFIGGLILIARHAQSQIIVNPLPDVKVERLYTAKELAKAIDGALDIQQRLHDRELASVVIGAQDYVRIQLVMGCPDRV